MRSNTKLSTMSSKSDIHQRCDGDTGLCNSSNATNSLDSLSDHDGSDYDGRTFDYFPPAVKIRSGCGMSLDYDEAHEVKSEDSSNNDINSPRSDLSDGIEMSTFSSRKDVPEEDDDDFIYFRRDLNSHQNDFGTDNESDEGTCIKDYYKQGYRPLVRAPESDFRPTFSSQSFLGGSSASNLRRNDVDTRINFVSLKGDSSRSGRYSRNLSPHRPMSDKVRIKKNMYSNKKDPPFGHGADHLDKVAQSVDSLISRQPDRDVKNMPEGSKLEPLAPEESKKIKKKIKKKEKCLMKGQLAMTCRETLPKSCPSRRNDSDDDDDEWICTSCGYWHLGRGKSDSTISPKPSIEKRITLRRSQNDLGMVVEAADKGVNGCVVKSLTPNGAVAADGRVQVGDHIMSVNNESMQSITNAEAHVILRRATQLSGADISMSYVTAADAASHMEATANRPPDRLTDDCPNETRTDGTDD